MINKNISLTLITSSLLALNITPSQAVDKTAGLYEPLGVRAGSFVIKPSIESHNEWNDNIYLTQEDEVSDFIFHIKPQLEISSDWNNHSLKLITGGDIVFYESHSDEDRQNYFVNVLSRFDVVKDSFATADFYYENTREDRGSPDSLGSTEPVEYETIGGKVGYEHKFNRVKVNVSHDVKHLDFKDSNSNAGNTLTNSDRSRLKNTSEARLGYELFSGYEAYLLGRYNFIDYDNPFRTQGNLDRSSDGYAAEAGITIEITRKLLADAHVGYREQDYDSAVLKTISGVTGGLDLQWLATQLTTVYAGVNRDIHETTQADALGNYASGFFNTAVTLGIEHELLRNLMLNAYGGYSYNEYEGISRKEDLYDAGLSAKYLFNRNFFLKAGYKYRSRDTNLNNVDYESNSVFFNLGAQL